MAEQGGNKVKIGNLTAIYRKVPKEKRPVANKLIQEIGFMADSMEKLKEQIAEVGPVELFEQGKQRFWRENPALRSYATLSKQLSAYYTQLLNMIPKEEAKAEDDGFDAFVNSREDG